MFQLVDNKKIIIMVIAAAAAACVDTPPVQKGYITGMVVLSQPIGMAEIGVWNIHEDGAVAKQPSYRGWSDPSGHFAVPLYGFEGPFLVTASAGISSDYYDTTDDLLRFDPEPHMRAVVLEHEAGEGQEVVLSPITTLITVLAEVRSAEESPWAPLWHAEVRDLELDQVERMHQLVDEHFLFDSVRTRPSLDMASASEEELRHGLVLAGLASIAAIVAECWQLQVDGVQRWNTIITSAALVRDARGPERRMDGIGPNGPVPIGICQPSQPSIMVSPDTLRRDLGDALVARFLASAANPGIDPAEVSDYLEHLATNNEPGLFGEGGGLSPTSGDSNE